MSRYYIYGIFWPLSQVRRKQVGTQLPTEGPSQEPPQGSSQEPPEESLQGAPQVPPPVPPEGPTEGGVTKVEGLHKRTTRTRPGEGAGTQRPSRRRPAQLVEEASAVVKGPKKAGKRGNKSQVPESDAPIQTRGALGKRFRQYGYGLYTDEPTGTVILNPGRSSEVLISGPTQESTAAPTKKKKTSTSTVPKKNKRKNPARARAPAPAPSPAPAPAPFDSIRPMTFAAPSESVDTEKVEEEVARPVRKSARIMNQVKGPSKGGRTGGVVHID